MALLLLLCGLLANAAQAESIEQILPQPAPEPDFAVNLIAGPFDHPWSVAFLPGGRMLVTERWGELKLVEPGNVEPRIVRGVPPRPVEDHAGLMDIILDPDFEANQIVYLSYVDGSREAATVRVLRARLNIETPSLEDGKVIFNSYPPTPGLEEFGGRMAIDAAGYLFLSLGDRYDRTRAQDLGDDHGSIIRMRRDGSFPDDNPFIGVEGARPGIWSYGHRNPQGLAFDKAGRLWATEHGPKGGDEFNLIQRGRNYGWPVITYGVEYSDEPINGGLTQAEGMEQPLRYWTPSIAPSGLTLYSGEVTEWENTVWLGALAGQMLVRLTLEGAKVVREEQFLKEELGRIREVRTGPDGMIYITTDSGEGGLYRIEPTEEYAIRSRPSLRQVQ